VKGVKQWVEPMGVEGMGPSKARAYSGVRMRCFGMGPSKARAYSGVRMRCFGMGPSKARAYWWS